MKLLISIVLVALIMYAVYIAKDLSSRAKKICTVIAIVIAIVTGVVSGVLPIVGVIVGFKCDLTVASKATEWFQCYGCLEALPELRLESHWG